MYIADTLSRAPFGKASVDEMDNEMHIHSKNALKSSSITEEILLKVKLASHEDEIINKIEPYYNYQGWPRNIKV